jgi:hypothetical protein
MPSGVFDSVLPPRALQAVCADGSRGVERQRIEEERSSEAALAQATAVALKATS